MIVVFIVVLVVFGPQKLPELARSLGKLMAEFRKASGDFKSAFEDEMRDLERQARVLELKKQALEATAAAADGAKNPAPATLGSPEGTESQTPAEAGGVGGAAAGDTRQTEALEVKPAAESVAREDAGVAWQGEIAVVSPEGDGGTPAGDGNSSAETSAAGKTSPSSPSHDQQQPA